MIETSAPDDVISHSVRFADVPTLAGRHFQGSWFSVAPDRARAFDFAAYVDDNPVEMDGDRYPDGLVEGFHLIALLDHLLNPLVNVSGDPWFGWNYGLDRVRFVSPIHAGEPIRLTGTVTAVEPRGEGFLLTFDCTVEVQCRAKPGFVAEWRVLWVPEVGNE